ncbi:hypothetical protein ACCS91_24275 [Rhizobium ruizarguesonis]
MRYFVELYRAVGGRLVAIPGALGFLFAATAFLRERVQFLSWLPAVPNIEAMPAWALALLALVPLCFWALVGLTANATSLRQEKEHLQSAWDRSGRDLISLRQAMDIIIENLSDQWPTGPLEERQRRAAAKIRQIGHENQIPIWAVERLDEDEGSDQTFQEHMVQIPPHAWKTVMIDPVAVYARHSTPDLPVLHTMEDPAFALSIDAPTLFGDLRVKAASIQAAFPARRR